MQKYKKKANIITIFLCFALSYHVIFNVKWDEGTIVDPLRKWKSTKVEELKQKFYEQEKIFEEKYKKK
jgi:hypothetical protein